MDEILRGYQHTIIDKVLRNLSNSKAVMVQMPTGTGKTTVMASLVRTYLKKVEPNKRILIVVHRKELVEQIYLRLRKFGIVAGIIMSGEDYEPTKQVQVASISTLIRKKEIPLNISLVIIDEAHHILANTYLGLLKGYKDSKVLGLTATPIRLNGEGFNYIFDSLICSESIEWFISKNYLSQYKHLALLDESINTVNIDSVKKDYDQKSLSELMQSERKIANVLAAYQRYSMGRKTIVFCVDIKHMNKLSEKFSNEGIDNRCIDSFTKKDVRESILKKFREGQISVLFNVNIFTEGFDCPDIETVILARPTKSLSLYIQQIGRVLRYKSGNYGLILDCGNLISEHGSILSNQNWSLDPSGLQVSSSEKTDSVGGSSGGKYIEEEDFEELKLLDEFITMNESFKPSYQQMNEIVTSLSKIEFHYYNTLNDLNYLVNGKILKILRIKYKRSKFLNKGEKIFIRNRCLEYLSMLENAVVVKKVNTVKKDQMKEKMPQFKRLTHKDILAIKEEMSDVFNGIID